MEVVKKLLGELTYSEIFIDEGTPDPDLGLNYDVYVNNVDFEIFKKENDVWVAKGFMGDANVNPDWDETDTSKKTYILNKPDFVTPEMFEALQESLEWNILNLNEFIEKQGVMGFQYDEQENKLSIVRPDNTIEDGVSFPVCDGLKPGFIDVDTFLQVYQSKQDITNEVTTRASTDVVGSSFDPSTNTLKLHRSDETILEQILPVIVSGKGVTITLDENDDYVISIDDFELFIPVSDLDSVDDPETNKIYLVPVDSSESNNVFNEYVWINDEWELIGSLSVDLTGYVYDPDYVHTDNNYTSLEKQKLDSLENYEDTEIKNTLNDKADKFERNNELFNLEDVYDELKVQSIYLVLEETEWTGSSAPYTQELSDNKIKSESKGHIGISHNATFSQAEDSRKALIRIIDQDDGSLTIVADGEKPTEDIPITLQLWN